MDEIKIKQLKEINRKLIPKERKNKAWLRKSASILKPGGFAIMPLSPKWEAFGIYTKEELEEFCAMK